MRAAALLLAAGQPERAMRYIGVCRSHTVIDIATVNDHDYRRNLHRYAGEAESGNLLRVFALLTMKPENLKRRSTSRRRESARTLHPLARNSMNR